MTEATNESKLASADSLTTTQRDGAVKLRLTETGPGSEPPITIIDALKETVDRVGHRPALGWKVGDSWSFLTYKQYYEKICCTARGLIKVGLEPYYGVGIIGFNAPEWFMAGFGAIFAGGIQVGIYTTNSPEACHYVLENADCQIAVVEDDVQLRKILEVRDRLPHLKTIVQYKGQPKDDCPDVLSWDALMTLGESKDEELEQELQKRIAAQAPNKCCTLIYTSGTTGNPKGVMLSHDNLIWTSRAISDMFHTSELSSNHRSVSYLPLSHGAAQMSDLYTPMYVGGTVYFAQPDALRGTLKNTMLEVRPTTFLGVPRVWEKLQEGIKAAERANGTVKQWIVSWARDIGLRSNLVSTTKLPRPMLYPLAKALVFEKVHAALGLDQCLLFLSGAAPIMRDTIEFFMSLDIPIMEGYGTSEDSGPHSFTTPETYNITSVGREIPGVTTLLVDADKAITGEGEICMSGRHVMMGYLGMPDKTKEAIDDEGWLHTGDIGRKDENGLLYITGRIKELIITAGGENVPPVPIEDKVKQILPYISNCMLIGDKRKFLSMLLTFKVQVDPNTMEPTELLMPAAVDWCSSIGSSAKTVADIVDKHDSKVMVAIQKDIDTVNKQATSRAQCIQKWSIIRKDFSVPGGELGPTLKLKRPEVLRIYAGTIDSLYAETENGGVVGQAAK